jgi:hypothetical protein
MLFLITTLLLFLNVQIFVLSTAEVSLDSSVLEFEQDDLRLIESKFLLAIS